jgi:hypothetical protein
MQQAAAGGAVVANESFMLNIGPAPWDNGAIILRPLSKEVCERIELVIERMAPPDYSGKKVALIPASMVVKNAGDVPCTYFVAVAKENAGTIQLNQLSMQFDANGAEITKRKCVRQIMTPDHIKAMYRHIEFSHGHIEHDDLDYAFWDVLFGVWGRVCCKIRADNPKVENVVRSLGGLDIDPSTLIQVVLQATIMRPNQTIVSLMIPVGNVGNTFVSFTRVDDTTINAVFIRFHYTTPPVTQWPLNFVIKLRQAFPEWSFVQTNLTCQELHELVQVPVWTRYLAVTNDITMDYLRPRLHMFLKAFHKRVKGKGVGIIGEDPMKNIIAMIMAQWKKHYE